MTRPDSVIVGDVADIHRAAIAYRSAVCRLAEVSIDISDNIASRRPMIDAQGRNLADSVFATPDHMIDWWRVDQLALYSPLAKACRYESMPFWANAEGFRTQHPNLYLDQLSTTDFERRAFVAVALVVPVHLPFGQIGMAAFRPVNDSITDMSHLYSEHADTLMMLTHRFMSSYVQATRRRRPVPANCHLSKREVECLRWAAAGKTDHEIAKILERSHSTVRFHIMNAAEKLSAVNRSQTVFKAGQLGFLGLAN